MGSPDKISFTRYIRIHRNKVEPIYLQIAYQFINAVQRGYLPLGTKISGSRVLAEELGVHRKTIIAAFDELQAQGWVEIIPKKGTFVGNPQLTKTLTSTTNKREDAGFTFRKSFLLDSPFEKNECDYHFNDGQPDYRLVNLDELSRFYRSSLKRKQVLKRLGDFSSRGNPYFLSQLGYYLNVTRSIHVSKDNILVAKNKELLLFSLAKQLIQPGDCVLVGELSFFFANMIFQQAGATIKTIPLDKDGLDVSYIRSHFKKGEIRCLYLNSHNFYPTTIALSEKRRKELVQLAHDYSFIILEDNDDYEFQYEKSAIPSLFHLDNNGIVVYIGSFGKILNPTFQIGFMLAPKNFTQEMAKFLQVLEPQEDLVLEQVLGEMIEEGSGIRYQKKASKTYKEKRDDFAEILQENLGNVCSYEIPTGGLAFWIQFKVTISLNQLVKHCKKNNLFLPRICLYQNQQITALRLGFGHLNKEEMTQVVLLLKKSVEETLSTN